jgi:hypothetical protein
MLSCVRVRRLRLLLSLSGCPVFPRQPPWHELPENAARCQWMGDVCSATHRNFAGFGSGVGPVNSLVTRTAATFLNGVRKGKGALLV